LCDTNQGQAEVSFGVNSLETGILTGKGKNKTFTQTSVFTVGETVIIHAYVFNGDTGLPVSNATVEITISGPDTVILTSNPSDSNGVAEATWTTTTPNKKGVGGTAAGEYSATVTNVTTSGYLWDGVPTSIGFFLE
jgi:hypothetical protein